MVKIFTSACTKNEKNSWYSCEENSDIHVPLLERGHILLELRSRDLRIGRAPKDLKISFSKMLALKFNCVSLLIFEKQLDPEKKKKSHC